MLESVNNDKVKYLSKLNDKKYRNREKMFLACGKHLVEEAMKRGIVNEIFLLDGEEDIYGGATYVSLNVMKKITDLTTPPKEAALCHFLDNSSIVGNVIILDDIKDPGNLGTIIRSAVAFNYDTIILSRECVDIYNSKVIRASEGMIFNINIVIGDIEDIINKLDDYTIFVTDVLYGSAPWKCIGKHAIVIGSEANGVRDSIKNKYNNKIKLPMNNKCESLNAGVSASILMYVIGGIE